MSANYSGLDDDRIFAIVQDNYLFSDNIQDISRSCFGSSNEIFIIALKFKPGLIIRIYNPKEYKKKPKYIQIELSILELLKDHFPVPEIIKTKSNSNFFNWESSYAQGLGSVFTKEPGEIKVHFVEENSFAIARFLGQFHKFAAVFTLDASESIKKIEKSMEKLKPTPNIQKIKSSMRNRLPAFTSCNGEISKQQSKNIELLLEIEESILQTGINEYLTQVEIGIIHMDIQNFNVLWEGDVISAILDWEETRKGYLLWDLGFTALYWSISSTSKTFSYETFCKFLNEYETIKPFTEHDRIVFPYILLIVWFRTIKWLIREDNRIVPVLSEFLTVLLESLLLLTANNFFKRIKSY